MSFKNDKEKFSYALGMNVATSLLQQGLQDIDTTIFSEGVVDTFKADFKLSPEEANEILQSYMQKVQAEQQKAQATQFAGNIEAGKKYLEENAEKDGVIVLDSGLQYEVLTSGDGASPQLTDTVTTHYHGILINGTVFDSSVERNSPASFPVNGVIAGWTEALQLMKEGDKWRLTIPSELAYGERGAGGAIEPYSTLVFEVELIKVG